MSFFENENIKKGWNSKKKYLWISIGIIVIALLSFMWGLKIVEDKKREVYDLETIISGDSKDSKINKRVKLKIREIKKII